MYYVMHSDPSSLLSQTSIPRVEKRPSSIDFLLNIWSTQPLIDRWPEVIVSFNKQTPRLDYLATTSSLDICSKRLISEMKTSGAEIEGLPIKIIDRASRRDTKDDYCVIHPLISFQAFDLAKSSRRASGHIKSLYPSRKLSECTAPVIRDDEHWLILIAEDLKDRLVNLNISGIRFSTIKDYASYVR